MTGLIGLAVLVVVLTLLVWLVVRARDAEEGFSDSVVDGVPDPSKPRRYIELAATPNAAEAQVWARALLARGIQGQLDAKTSPETRPRILKVASIVAGILLSSNRLDAGRPHQVVRVRVLEGDYDSAKDVLRTFR